MPHKIHIVINDEILGAKLNDTHAARAILAALPIEAAVHRWGDEIYFMTQIAAEPDDEMRDVMQPGELAYWPPGKAFCIFWGPTPGSQAAEPRAASDVVPIGRITGDLGALAGAADGDPIRIERA